MNELFQLGRWGDRVTDGIVVLQYTILVGTLSQIWQAFFPDSTSNYVLCVVFLIETLIALCVLFLYINYRRALKAAKQVYTRIKANRWEKKSC
jgi:hypothetical protein